MLKLTPRPKVITFDCYGTLVQWHSALKAAVRAVLMEHLDHDDANEDRIAETTDALRTWSIELQQRPPYRDYKTILRSSLAEVMARKGFSTHSGDGGTLLSHLEAIPPHPEVPGALERLRTRFPIAIISNTDDDLIAGTVAQIGVPFDFVITAQQARAYKPDHGLFRHAHAVMAVKADETLHVGMGQFTDLKVCDELGIRVVWINRLGEEVSPVWTPDAILPDLTALTEILV